MTVLKSRLTATTALAFTLSLGLANTAVLAQEIDGETTDLGTIVLSAEEQIKQALGVSKISAEDLEKTPVVNDVSEIIRKMPGVNLTGATASGQRGNQRQIDIRGMGPENTLILIDGKPVSSRNSVRMGRAGERDTRGDSNWVAAELIESIEVIRGPAAARYGSGASGGVVNIITKRPTEQTAQVGLHFNAPESSAEGGSMRANVMVAGPIGERLSFRLNANRNETDSDAPDINDEAIADINAARIAAGEDPIKPAGREGVLNEDIGTLLSWAADELNRIDLEFSYSRQGNKFAGDTQNSGAYDPLIDGLASGGAETNVMRRRVLSLTHSGDYSFGTSNSYIQLENTRNSRLGEGTKGSNEGKINSDEMKFIELNNLAVKSEWVLPFAIGGKNQSLTLGAEFRQEKKNDQASLEATTLEGVEIPGTELDPTKRNPNSEQSILSLYAESNIEWNDQLTLTPALRLDHSDTFGAQLSPGLNASYAFDDIWTMKLGVARAFKAPNLFQLDPDYVYYSNGKGCALSSVNGVGCYVVGNPDLKAETALNTEIGMAYNNLDSGLAGSLTYFHSDYKNRIASGVHSDISAVPGEDKGRLLKWENTPEAVVAGLEGNIGFDIGQSFAFNANFTKMLESKNKSNGQPLSLVPDHTINASLAWTATDALTVTLSGTHYGRIEAAKINANTDKAADFTDPRGSYALFNLGATYDVTDSTRLAAGVTNLFEKQINRTGQGANTFNEPGRAFYLSLNKTF